MSPARSEPTGSGRCLAIPGCCSSDGYAAVDTTAAVTVLTACASSSQQKCSNPLTADVADGAAGAAAVPATTTLQRLRHQCQAILPGPAQTWPRWDRCCSPGAASPDSSHTHVLSSRTSISSSKYTHTLAPSRSTSSKKKRHAGSRFPPLWVGLGYAFQ